MVVWGVSLLRSSLLAPMERLGEWIDAVNGYVFGNMRFLNVFL